MTGASKITYYKAEALIAAVERGTDPLQGKVAPGTAVRVQLGTVDPACLDPLPEARGLQIQHVDLVKFADGTPDFVYVVLWTFNARGKG